METPLHDQHLPKLGGTDVQVASNRLQAAETWKYDERWTCSESSRLSLAGFHGIRSYVFSAPGPSPTYQLRPTCTSRPDLHLPSSDIRKLSPKQGLSGSLSALHADGFGCFVVHPLSVSWFSTAFAFTLVSRGSRHRIGQSRIRKLRGTAFLTIFLPLS